jgi:hypothetical protein
MKERGIIFSDPMVRANLEGRKTQTRRVMYPQPPKNRIKKITRWENQPRGWFAFDKYDNELWPYRDFGIQTPKIKNPYGVVGDRFYMRETWSDNHSMHYAAEGPVAGILYRATANKVLYRGENVAVEVRKNKWVDYYDRPITWKPSIHMPKKFARPDRFEITDIRVERVQDITAVECEREGLRYTNHPNLQMGRYNRILEDFKHLWDSINAKTGYGWQINPWVWVICYKKL